MADENIISVTNNENPPINLEIISYKNEVGVTYIQSQGDKGEKGDRGEKGDKGDRGEAGVSTMLVSSFTGAVNGSNATFILNDHYDDVIVFINGIKYSQSDYTFTKTTKTVVFGFAIPIGYTLEFYGITNNVDAFATETYVTDAIENVVKTAPAALNTLQELADAMNDDANFASTITTALSNKVDKVAGKVLSENDLTDDLKSHYDTAYTNTHSHWNQSILDSTNAAFTSSLNNKITSAYSHSTSLSNPHSVTKAQVGLENVPNTDCTTTTNITDSTDKRFVTDAQKNILSNTSGTNTGDETASSIKSKLGITTLSGSNTGDQDLSGYATTTTLTNGLAGKVDTVSGKSLSTNDLTNALKSNYDTAFTNTHTHSNATALNNLTGTNTGDETTATIKSKLGITTLSGSNTGDQDLSALNNHLTNTSNPHSVTKTQVGLGNVPNINPYYQVHTLMTSAANFAVSHAYYFGSRDSFYTDLPAYNRLYSSGNGAIKSVYLQWQSNNTMNVADNLSLYIRVNNTTDYLLTNTFNVANAFSYFNYTGLNIPLSTGDYWEFKLVTPSSLVTLPQTVTVRSQTKIECGV